MNSITTNDNALRQQGDDHFYEASQSFDANTKIARVVQALKQPSGLNRFEAERIGDHCLNTTIARLRQRGHTIISSWEEVPSRFTTKGVRVRRYWAIEECERL